MVSQGTFLQLDGQLPAAEQLNLGGGNIGIMENKMETTGILGILGIIWGLYGDSTGMIWGLYREYIAFKSSCDDNRAWSLCCLA